MKKNYKYSIKGKKLTKIANELIPGGNMFLSKRSDINLPNNWPNYFSKSKKIFVWDLDGKKYLDFSQMGVGTNILGYANKEIDNEIKKTISKGNSTTLNAPEEVYLSKKLIKMHPWFEMVKYCRTGGEANSLAIRIARSYSGKENIAFCGYHGWHDWYLASNLNKSSNLDEHLLTNLKTSGVNSKLKNTSFPFAYNDIDGLKKLIKEKNIGIIKMEVLRNELPKKNFLKKVREIANKNNIVLIFDECTTGFRESFGGLHKKFNVYPDLVIFGKALGNGYPITAILGKRKIMINSEKSFVSSTFWSERLGYVAALKTIEIMKREKSWLKIVKIGKKIINGWKSISKRTKVKIIISGSSSICSFNFDYPEHLILKTFITQELLKKGILGSTSFYASICHEDKYILKYLKELEKIFIVISRYKTNLSKIKNLLDGPVCIEGIKRIN